MNSATHRQDSTDNARRAVHGTCPPAGSIRTPPKNWKRCVHEYAKRHGVTKKRAVREILSRSIGPYDPEHGKFGW